MRQPTCHPGRSRSNLEARDAHVSAADHDRRRALDSRRALGRGRDAGDDARPGALIPADVETLWKPLPAIRGDSAVAGERRFGLATRLGRLPATHGDYPGSLCKPEAAGSIPARSNRKGPQAAGLFVFQRAWPRRDGRSGAPAATRSGGRAGSTQRDLLRRGRADDDGTCSGAYRAC